MPKARREWALGLAGSCAIAAVACTTEPAATGHRLTLSPCHVERLGEQVLCGVHEVFENRDALQGRRIPIHVAVLPALRRTKDPDPLFVLAGGPGQGARSYAPAAARAFRRIRRTRDLVLVDLRGTGASNPLHCRAQGDDLDEIGSLLGAEFARRCLAGIDADVRRYAHREALADLDEIRQALGYDRINLWGGSWGTRAALLHAARYAATVRSVVLDGAAPFAFSYPLDTPADSQRALDLLIAACARDPWCHAAFPDIRNTISDVLSALRARPVTVELRHPRTHEVRRVTLTRARVAEALRVFLYTPDDASLIPALFDRAARGDFEPMLGQVLRSAAWSTGTMAIGATLAVLCTEDIGPIGAARIDEAAAGSFLGGAGIAGWRDVCAAWPAGERTSVSRAVTLNTPALILSGGRDPVTPPRWGDAMSRHFTNSIHLVAEGAAHNVSFSGCVPDLIAQFVETGSTRALVRTCVASIVPPPFVISHAGHRP